ncbi:uncharacterized protein [Pocillopora verrucosa]|uniref:uncharacterized protein n=1 Tax=Pocillopora verrucosa TaxID=203993 RepID=UPI00333E8EB1
MELIKKGSSAEISDNSATVTAENTGWFGTFGEREEINEREQSQPIYTWQSNTDVTRRLLFISIAVGTTAFLTAIAALVLALVMMKSNTFNTSSTFPTDHGALQGVSELEKNVQEMKRNLSVVREYSGKNTAELWLILNGTVHQKFFDFQKQILKLDQKVKNVRKIPGPIGPSGYNGSQGPVGPQGVPGPAGPKGSGDLRQCQLEKKSQTKIAGSNRILVHVDEPTNKRIMAVTCSTDHGTEYNLVSRVQSGNVRRYVCVCDGKSTLFNGGSSCYLHYWICPLTT